MKSSIKKHSIVKGIGIREIKEKENIQKARAYQLEVSLFLLERR